MAGADLRAALVANCLRGALPVFVRALCLFLCSRLCESVCGAVRLVFQNTPTMLSFSKHTNHVVTSSGFASGLLGASHSFSFFVWLLTAKGQERKRRNGRKKGKLLKRSDEQQEKEKRVAK